jgi:hypothetical protein
MHVIPIIRGRNVTLLMAINGNSIVHFKIFNGGCNSEIFSQFLLELDEKMVNELNISDGTIIIDNARAHTSNEFRESMRFLQNRTLFFVSIFIYVKPH